MCEILLSFGGEADDHVACDLGVGEVFTDSTDEVAVLFDGVSAVHGFEHAVGAGLGGDMKVPADARTVAYDFEDVVPEITGETGYEAQAFNSGDFFVNSI